MPDPEAKPTWTLFVPLPPTITAPNPPSMVITPGDANGNGGTVTVTGR